MGSFVTIEAGQKIQAVTLENPGLEEAPIDGTDYVRNSKAWVPATGGDGGIGDAPDDGMDYVRNSERWVQPVYGIGDAPDDGMDYVRNSEGWVQPVYGIGDAPDDGMDYVRNSEGWVQPVYGIGDAPDDGMDYVRNSEGWVPAPPSTITFKNDSFGSAVENMIAGRVDGAEAVIHKSGNIYSTGGTTWSHNGGTSSDLDDFDNIGIVNFEDFNPDKTGVEDCTAILQQALTYFHGVYWTGAYDTASDGGGELYVPHGSYLIKDTLFIGSSTHLRGAGWTTKFIFDPDVPDTDFLVEYNKNANPPTGGAAERSTYNITCTDFMVSCKLTGGSIPGRGGVGTVSERNRNSRHGIYLKDTCHSLVNRVGVVGFWQGTAVKFERINEVFTYYNNIQYCRLADNKVDIACTSATTIQGNFINTAANFPCDTLGKDYMVDLKSMIWPTHGVSIHGGSLEGYFNIACVRDFASGTSIKGVYTESKNEGAAFVDARGRNPNIGAGSYSGNYNAHSNVILQDRDASGTGSNFSAGIDFGLGDAIPIEAVAKSGTSYHGRTSHTTYDTHWPNGGTVSMSNEDTLQETYCAKMARSATSEDNECQINFQFRFKDTMKLGTTVWCTIAVKATDVSDTPDDVNWRMRLLAENGNNYFEKVASYSDGWSLYSTQFPTSTDYQVPTITVAMIRGSTDSSRYLLVGAPRFYTNGYQKSIGQIGGDICLPSQPTSGQWRKGERVYSSSPESGEPQGWVCSTEGDFESTPPTFIPMPSFE